MWRGGAKHFPALDARRGGPLLHAPGDGSRGSGMPMRAAVRCADVFALWLCVTCADVRFGWVINGDAVRLARRARRGRASQGRRPRRWCAGRGGACAAALIKYGSIRQCTTGVPGQRLRRQLAVHLTACADRVRSGPLGHVWSATPDHQLGNKPVMLHQPSCLQVRVILLCL